MEIWYKSLTEIEDKIAIRNEDLEKVKSETAKIWTQLADIQKAVKKTKAIAVSKESIAKKEAALLLISIYEQTCAEVKKIGSETTYQHRSSEYAYFTDQVNRLFFAKLSETTIAQLRVLGYDIPEYSEINYWKDIIKKA